MNLDILDSCPPNLFQILSKYLDSTQYYLDNTQEGYNSMDGYVLCMITTSTFK